MSIDRSVARTDGKEKGEKGPEEGQGNVMAPRECEKLHPALALGSPTVMSPLSLSL